MKRYLVVTMLLAAGLVNAQQMITLQDAVATALEKNAAIQVARNSAVIAGNTARAGLAELLPKISLSAGANYTDYEDLGATTVSSAGVSASYTLFDGLGNVYRLKQAQSTGQQGALSARNQIENTILQVSQAYYTAASAWEGLNIAKEALAISRERLTRAQERNRYGQAGTVEVLSARVDVNSDSVSVVNARLSWDQARRNLNVLLYRDIALPLAVNTAVNYDAMPEAETLFEQAEQHNASYLIYQESSRQAGFGAKVAGSSLLPRVDLTGSATYSQTLPDLDVGFDDLSRTIRAGANISWTLFNGSRLRLQYQSARLTARNQAMLADEALRDLLRHVTNSRDSYSNSRLVLDLETQNLEAAELNFQHSRDLYRLGQVTNTQFREAQLNLIRSKNRLQAAKYSAKLNELTLKKLSGTLVTENQLGLK